MKPARSIPFEWGTWGVIPSQNEDFCGPEEMVSSSNVSYQPYLPVIGSEGRFHGVDVVDSGEEMEPFDVERFVDRLVEDDPPTKAAYIWGAPVAADTLPEVVTKSGNSHPSKFSSAAKLFLQPIHSQSWPEQRLAASAQGAEWRRADDEPSIVSHDTFLDALFTPGRVSSPEVVRAAVKPGFVRLPIVDNNDVGIRSGIAAFDPSAIHNIPLPVESLPVERQAPWALARSSYGGFPLLSPGTKPVSSAFQILLHKRKHFDGITYLEVPNNVLDNSGYSTADAAAPTRLIGADAFSVEYDDDRHTFLRQQEIVHRVGPGYLAGFGQAGLVCPSQRTALVDWVSHLHAAAPGGGPRLSLETLLLAVNLFDRFLSTDEGGLVAFGSRGGLKVAGAACLGIASKYEDTQPTSLWRLATAGTWGETKLEDVKNGGSGTNSYSGGAGDDELHAARKDIAAMELRVLSALSYRLTVPTALSFLEEFIRRASLLGFLPEGPAAETVRTEAQQILLRVLRDVTWLEHMPSALAAAALYWASCISSPGAAPPSSFAFFAITGYQLEVLCRCLRDMEAVRTGRGDTGRRDGGLGFGWAGAALPEHAERTLFGAGGGHPAIAAL